MNCPLLQLPPDQVRPLVLLHLSSIITFTVLKCHAPPPLFISYMFQRLMKTSGNGSDSGPCESGSRSGSKWFTLKKKIIRKVATTSLAMSYKFIQNIITPFNSKCLKDSYFSASSVRFTYGTFTRLFYVLVLDPDPHLFMRIRIRNTSWA